MKWNDFVFGIGLVGIGKMYLVVVKVVYVLKNGYIKKIILIRFVVEVGESFGFFSGDFKEKVDFYLCLLYDVFYDVFGVDYIECLMERGIIEIVLFVYMRGWMFDDVYVIFDEV